MNTERWQRVGDIFERLLEVPEDEREKRLASLCGDDQQLRGIVVSMLDSHESPRFSDVSLNTLRDSSQAAAATSLHGEPPPRDTETEGTRIGPWRLARRIGAGGMGVVWLAERADGQFKQRAALKLIKRGMDSEAVLARFLRERQILARLEHRNIAHLLDGGIAPDGRPYFAMEYVEGLPLLAYCNEHHLKLEERLRLFLQVCTALRFAHAQHVVHRDIKPSNILVTADGSVKLLDFGIAKLLQGDDELTSTLTGTQREQPMTPAYAAPEQIAGGEVTEATDVYALGVVFYELLSGRRPHDFSAAADAHDVLKIILATDPVAPGRLKLASSPVPLKRLRGDLDTIALTALRQMPTRRYPSVAVFAADIENYLGGRPIAARRDHIFYRCYKFARRHRAGLVAIIAVLSISLIAALFVFYERQAHGVARKNASFAIVRLANVAQNAEYPWVGAAVVPMLANELAHGSNLHRIADETVSTATAGVAPPTGDGLAAQGLSTLRKRLVADYVLSGSYVVSGSGADAKLRLDLAMQDARDGEAIANVTQTGLLSELPTLVERAGAELRTQLGFSLIGEDAKQEVARAQPPSTEVARHMGIALDALRKNNAALARAELTEVNVLAPNYAPAYAYLADAQKALGYDAKALAAAQQAQTLSVNLPQRQRLQIARSVAVQKADWARALEVDRQIVALNPSDPEAHLSLADDLWNAGDLDAADKALKALRAMPGGDDPRVDLRAASIARTRGDAKASAEYAQRALQTAQSRDEIGLAADAKRKLGIAREQMDQREEAATLYRQAIADYQQVGNPKGEADARTDLAILSHDNNQLVVANEEYQHALHIYQNIGDQRGLAVIYINFVRLLWARGDLDAAEAAVRRALAIAIDRGDISKQIWATTALGALQLSTAASDEALEKFHQALALSERAGDREKHLFALVKLTEALILRGDLQQAATFCEQAKLEVKQLSNPYQEIEADLQCADISFYRGDVSGASAMYALAADIAVKHRLSEQGARIDNRLAEIDMVNFKFSEANARLIRAAKASAEGEQIVNEATAQARMALAYRALKQFAESENAAVRARDLRSAITIRSEAINVDVLLAQIRGDAGSPGEAAALLLEQANEAEKRQWLSIAMEARLASIRFLQRTNAPAAAEQRRLLESEASEHGFGWILARLRDLK